MPLSTLQETPRDVPSKTRGQDGFATSFPVGLLHPLQHAGLSRRSPVSRHPTVDSFADFAPRLGADPPRRVAAVGARERPNRCSSVSLLRHVGHVLPKALAGHGTAPQEVRTEAGAGSF